MECIQTDEQGQVVQAEKELCQHAVSPLTEAICENGKPCERK